MLKKQIELHAERLFYSLLPNLPCAFPFVLLKKHVLQLPQRSAASLQLQLDGFALPNPSERWSVKPHGWLDNPSTGPQ